MLRAYTAYDIADPIRSGTAKEQAKNFSELMELFSRYGK